MPPGFVLARGKFDATRVLVLLPFILIVIIMASTLSEQGLDCDGDYDQD